MLRGRERAGRSVSPAKVVKASSGTAAKSDSCVAAHTQVSNGCGEANGVNATKSPRWSTSRSRVRSVSTTLSQKTQRSLCR